MKLLRTIQLDPSDTIVFSRAAAPGEWAVPGTFVFWDQPVDTYLGKQRAAFRSGMLGIASLGWSTLTIVSEASPDELEQAIEALSGQLLENFGAPSREMARAAAAQELAFAQGLAEPAVGTLVAVHRSFENGDIRERFRTLLPGVDERHDRAFGFTEAEEGEDGFDIRALDGGSKP